VIITAERQEGATLLVTAADEILGTHTTSTDRIFVSADPAEPL
jgi:hypothetical protein